MVLNIQHILQQGVAAHRAGNFQDAERFYRSVLQIQPKHADANHNLGVLSISANRVGEALPLLKIAVEASPKGEQFWLSYIDALVRARQFDDAKRAFKKARKQGVGGKKLNVLKAQIESRNTQAPSQIELNQLLTEFQSGRLDEAEALALSMTQDYPKHAYGWKMLGVVLLRKGLYAKAVGACQTAIGLSPGDAEIHYNLGLTFKELGRSDEAEASYAQAIKLKPDYPDPYWSMHSLQDTIQEAEDWLDQCLKTDENFVQAKLMRAALRFYQGDRAEYEDLMQSELAEHPFMRSFSWAFGLPDLPALYFDRWSFFDAVIEQSIVSRPFYEFGVWTASSFRYLIRTFKKGYGFDTFTGLPEDWDGHTHVEKKGSYSSDGNVPDIEGGEFIVGTFEETLPGFFSESRPVASVMNFDADLYSSTVCALNHSKPVMDKDTILIFDEFIMNGNWEEDEFKALEEFCSANDLRYEVIAISFRTKQVAVKLIGF